MEQAENKNFSILNFSSKFEPLFAVACGGNLALLRLPLPRRRRSCRTFHRLARKHGTSNVRHTHTHKLLLQLQRHVDYGCF
jgi:hypothetical protein